MRKRRSRVRPPAERRRHAAARGIAQAERLEERRLLSATVGWESVGAGSEIAKAGGRALLVVDAAVTWHEGLTESFSDVADAVVVGSGDDLFASVGHALERLGDVAAIHIVSHGSPGQFALGGTTFKADTIGTWSDGLVAWRRLAGPGADLFVWGCDVAGGDGASLIDAIHDVSGFDVAASTDVTGPARLGGDFDLEYVRGDVPNAELVAGVDVLWETTLEAPVEYDFTTTKVKSAVNAAFSRLENDIAPAIETALASRTGSTATDVLAQRPVADLFSAAGSISPADVATLLALRADAAAYLGGTAPTLAGLAKTLETKLAGLATAAQASTHTITVTPAVMKNAAGDTTAIELAVSIAVRGTTTAPLDRGPDSGPTAWGHALAGLDSDLNLKLRDVPQLETGSEFTDGFTIRVNLADPDNPVASIAIPALDLKAGFFGFAGVSGRIGALDLDSVSAVSTPVHATSVTFSGGSSRTLADWSSVGAAASALVMAPPATVDLPVTAKLSGTDVTTAGTKITVATANVLDDTAKPSVALADFQRLVWFGAISSDDIITAVLAAGRSYGAMAAAEGSSLSARIPFASKQTLGTVFDFADLFADEIGSKIDLTVDKTTNGTTVKVRPDDLQTFGDFATKFPALGIVPVYDSLTGTVSIQFSTSRTNTPAVQNAVEFPIAPLGTLGFTGGSAAAFSAPVAIGFGVRFDVAPATALVIQLPIAAAASGRLTSDAVLTITPAFGTATTVTVKQDDTANNGSAADLLADLNAALAATPLRARAGGFGGGFELYTPTVGPAMPAAITVTANRSAGSRELGFSDGLAPDASSPYTLFARTAAAGSTVVPHTTTKFATGSFTWSLDDRAGQVAYGLNTIGFTDTRGSVAADLSLTLAATGAAAETLGSDPTSVLTAALTDSASIVLSGLTHANGASTITSGSTISIGVSDFVAERVVLFTPQAAPLAIDTLEADGRTTGRLTADSTLRFTWGSDTWEATVTVAEAVDNVTFADLVADFSAALAGARTVVNDAPTGGPVDLSAVFSITGSAGRITIERTTETPAASVVTARLVPNLAAGGSTTGRLAADSTLEVVIGSTTYKVTVPRSATRANTAFADLVADF